MSFTMPREYQSLLTGVEVGVHLTALKSLPLALRVFPSHVAILFMASALRAAAVVIVVRSNNRLAAGVRLPGASARLGVHKGGAMLPRPCLLGVASPIASDFPATKFSNSAFALRFFDA